VTLKKVKNLQDYLINKIFRIIKTKNPKIVFDTRKIKEGDIFIGIKNKNNNGSNYYQEALKKKCLLAIIDKKIQNKKVIFVPNVMKFLKILSAKILNNYKGNIIAVTGSVGKTSFKENIYNFLAKEKQNAYKSYRNFNNELGLITNICNINLKSTHSIFELGINQINEMKKLTNILNPHYVLITNVENSHIGNFGNYKNLLLNKLYLLESTNLKKALVNLNKKYQLVPNKYKLNKNITFMNFTKDINFNKTKSKNKIFYLNFIYNFEENYIKSDSNDLISNNIAVISFIFISMFFYKSNYNKYFFKKSLLKGHGKVIKVNKNKRNYLIYDHSYNASPYSMDKNLDNFLSISNNTNRLIILGSMKELGNQKTKFHKYIIKKLLNLKNCIFIGEEFYDLRKKSNNNFYLNYIDSINDLNKYLKKINYVFVMGSRLNNLDKLIKKLC